MNIKLSLAALGAATMVGMGALTGPAAANSQTGGLVDKLAQRFNLNRDEVQKVFDEDRDARRAQMQQRYEERLTQAVKDGKLTEEQKSKLLAKHQELSAQMEAKHQEMKAKRAELEGKTNEERQQLKQQHREETSKLHGEIEAWEQANGIPSGYLLLGPGKHVHGPGHHGSHGYGTVSN